MYDKFCLKRVIHALGRGRKAFGITVFVASLLLSGQAMAIQFDLWGNPLEIKGYINQSIQFGVAGDHYDTMSGFQQALMQGLLEFEYRPSNDLKFFVTGQLTKDWAYDILDGDDDWEFRRFDQSRDEMSLRDDYEDVLKECHVTWTPGDFNIRVGKQIVTWGRMDGFRIMDQVNPQDARLGPSDVEFETTISPIWMAKVEYFPSWVPPFLYQLGFEVIYNPNADFIPSKKPNTGNEVYGIWSASAVSGPLRIMGEDANIHEPDRWTDGHEVGVRIKGTFPDSTYFTLNFFDGVANDPIKRSRFGEGDFGGAGILLDNFTMDDDGNLIAFPLSEGFYPDQTFIGFTFAREFTEIYSKALGGVSPLLRGEFTYHFDATFATNGLGIPTTPIRDQYWEHDYIYWGLGIEWKIDIPWLNDRRNIGIMPQFGHQHIMDYPDGTGPIGAPITLTGPLQATVSENMYNIFVNINTRYMNDKLSPSITYLRDIRSDVTHSTKGSVKKDTWIFNLKYEPDYKWSYKLRLSLFANDGNDSVDHYDNISFTVQYQF